MMTIHDRLTMWRERYGNPRGEREELLYIIAQDAATALAAATQLQLYLDEECRLRREAEIRAEKTEAQLAEPTAEKALREAAQRVADKYCDLMDEDGRVCSEDCECWHSRGGGCDGSSAIYRAALDRKEKA